MDEILADMLRGWAGVPDATRGWIRAAMQAFSLQQLGQTRRAGVRFWPPEGMPPEATHPRILPPALTTPARYLPQLRVMQLDTALVSTVHIRHELVHAWDHVRLMTSPQRLDDLAQGPRLALIERPAALWSDTALAQVFQDYLRTRSDLAFSSGAGASDESRQSPRDFYAEGYCVYQSQIRGDQRWVLELAPGLFDLLLEEARTESLPTVTREQLRSVPLRR